jgi:hypothetical protein
MAPGIAYQTSQCGQSNSQSHTATTRTIQTTTPTTRPIQVFTAPSFTTHGLRRRGYTHGDASASGIPRVGFALTTAGERSGSPGGPRSKETAWRTVSTE